MHELDDNALLREFAERRSEPAFAALVARHVNQVYSVALRHTRNPHAAEEITQAVFVLLARKAGALGKGVILSGWLYQTARLTAVTLLRGNIRRAQREQEVLMQNLSDDSAADPWPQIAPLLDDAMAGLSETDRHAVVLRYFDGKSLREVGAALGGSEDAAKMRVNRAVEKLRAFFTQRGVTLSAAGVAAAIAANSVQSAPIGLAAAVTTAALSVTGTTTATVIAAATKTIAMTTLQKTLVTVAVAVLAGAGIYEARQAAQLRGQNQTLQQAQSPLAEQLRQLQRERDDATNRLTWLRDELAKGKSNNLELLKLRSEVARLRVPNSDITKTPADAREALMKSWLAREDKLKQVVEQNADKTIPDLKLLSDQDWLNAAREAKFDTDQDVRHTLANLRHMAENAFAVAASGAVSKYMEANHHQFPTDLTQLQPYFDMPMDDAILQRWGIVPQTAMPNQRMGGDWVITEKVPVDRELDQRWAIGPGSYGCSSYPSSETAGAISAIDPALKAYAAANDGKEPTDPSQILPYLTTPELQAAYQTLLKNLPAKTAAQ